MLNLVQLAIADLKASIAKTMSIEDGNQLLFRLHHMETILTKNLLDEEDKNQLAILLFYIFIHQSHQYFAQFKIVLNAKGCLRAR